MCQEMGLVSITIKFIRIMESREVSIYVVCDEYIDKIALIKLGVNELPQKFYIAYIDKIRNEIESGPLPSDPASACLYESKDAFLSNAAPVRPINLTDSIGANGLRGDTQEPMLMKFIARNQAA